MPTSLPRVHVSFERPTFEILDQISKVEKVSLAHVVTKLVVAALELSEDLALGEKAESRLKTFLRDDALTSEELLKWNKNRRKRNA